MSGSKGEGRDPAGDRMHRAKGPKIISRLKKKTIDSVFKEMVWKYK